MFDSLLYRPFQRSGLYRSFTNRGMGPRRSKGWWDVLSVAVPPKYHQIVAEGRCRNAFAVTVTDVIIFILGKDYLHSQACYLQALPYTPYVVFQYNFDAGFLLL